MRTIKMALSIVCFGALTSTGILSSEIPQMEGQGYATQQMNVETLPLKDNLMIASSVASSALSTSSIATYSAISYTSIASYSTLAYTSIATLAFLAVFSVVA